MPQCPNLIPSGIRFGRFDVISLPSRPILFKFDGSICKLRRSGPLPRRKFFADGRGPRVGLYHPRCVNMLRRVNRRYLTEPARFFLDRPFKLCLFLLKTNPISEVLAPIWVTGDELGQAESKSRKLLCRFVKVYRSNGRCLGLEHKFLRLANLDAHAMIPRAIGPRATGYSGIS